MWMIFYLFSEIFWKDFIVTTTVYVSYHGKFKYERKHLGAFLLTPKPKSNEQPKETSTQILENVMLILLRITFTVKKYVLNTY